MTESISIESIIDVKGSVISDSLVIDKLSCHTSSAPVSDGVVHWAKIIKETSTDCGVVNPSSCVL